MGVQTVTISMQDITVYRIMHSNPPLKFNYAQWAPLRDFALLKAPCCLSLSHLVQPPLTAEPAPHSDQVPEGCIQLGLEKFHGKRLHDSSGQPVGLPMFMEKQIYLIFSLNFCCFNL